MPPATLAPSVSLRELADLAIGTPEVGAVNFTALHTLIVAMLKNLNLQEARINYQAQLPEQSRSFETPRASSSTPQLPVSKERRRSSVSGAPPQALESKVKDLSGQVQDLSRQLKTVESQVQAIVAHMQHVTVQTSGLQAREWLEAKEMDLLAQEKALRESMRVWKDLSELFFQNLLQRIDELERLTKERDKFLELVSRKLSMMPSMEEATMVTWEELEQAITDGWRASQVVSESSTGLPKRRGQSSVTSNDIIIPSGASTKRPSLDQAMESATGLITDKTFLGTSGIGYPSEGVTGRDRSRGTPAPGFPGREQHSRAWDEAGPAKPYHPTVSQFRIESDRHRSSREQHGLAHLRREEQDAHLGPVYQGLSPATLARDWHRGAYISQGPIFARPDQYGLGLLATDQLASLTPSTYAQGVVPLYVGQLGAVPPGMDEQELVLPDMVQRDVVPPLAPSRDEQGLELPRSDQPGVVPLRTPQHGVIIPGTDQRGIRQPGVDESGIGPLGRDERGLVPLGIDEYGFAVFPMDQQRLLSAGLMHVAAGPQGFVQPGFGTSGFIQPGTEQPGLVQPGASQPGLVQPGVGHPDLVQPGAAQPGLVLPGAPQPDLVQPGVVGQPDLVQPGAPQPDLVQPGAAQPVLVQPGAAQPGLVQPGAAQPGLVLPGAAQPGLVLPGAAQPGLVQPGAAQPGLVQPGAAQPGLVQPGIYQPGMVQPGAAQPGMAQPGAAQPGLVQPGIYHLGSVQPGTAQPGVVQPSATQPGIMQPGAAQPGVVQPGAAQPGLVQPGAAQPGLVQRSAGQPGLVQAGLAPHGFFQPGASMPGLFPPGLVQPGAHPRGFMRPGTDQRGLVQPAIDHRWLRQSATDRGLIPPGTELPGFPTIHADPPSFLSPSPHQHGVVYPGRDQHGWGSPFLASQGLALRGTDQEGLEPREAYQQGLMPPGGAQHGPTPLRTRVGSASRDPQPLETPEPDERGDVAPAAEPPDQARFSPGSQDLGHPGPRGPGYPGVDLFVQVGLDPHETYDASHPRMSIQTTPSHEAAFLGDTPLPDSSHRASSDRSNIQTERHDSLDKLAPSFPMAVETFRLMGELVGLYVELKENMKELDEEQAGQTDLEKLQFLLALMVRKSIPADLQEQVKTLKALTKEVCQEKAKLDRVNKILEGEQEQETGKDVKAGPLSLQLGILRVTVADIEKELAELRESQERGKISLEHSVSEASLYLQDQLDKLRTIIENMLASSSKLLSMSISVAPQKTLTALTPGELDPEATCPACSLDLSHQVSMLVQRYEQLQDMVSNLAASRPSKKAKLQSQDEELLGHIQGAILQVQGDCEKLNVTTSSLIEDHRQKQKDIDLLYQGLEKLEKEKANREHLEMEIDVKADKSALAGKVSRVQFDATTEQLNHMMQELVAKMSGQEQDWQKMLDKLLVQMDNKLDRLELDPVRQSLEDRWKSLRQQLKERSPLYQADEAAAMRRQLLAHFHCLSCDRPLETPVTGQVIPVTPVSPGLPGHRSIRPYMVFELEQVRQQSRSLKLGSAAFPRGDLAKTERSVGRLRSMHSKMLMDIEKVQIHFGGSVKASSQMIRELLQAQCLSSPCYKRVPETADYTYSTVPRRCGGSHTLTYPYRRSRLQHPSQGLCPTEEIQIAMKHNEVDILGLDGHIYKGRMDTRLPGILSRDNLGILKPKPKQLRPHAHQPPSLSDSGQRLSRPQSARMLAGHNSGSSLWREGPSGWSRHCPRLSSSPAWPLSHPGLAHTFTSWREGGPGS
uniref:DUF4795 domain-containing protein n=1 Tax=Sus scrofa TaxID=9823 RepID=A0A8D1G8Q6_PIG